MRTLTLFPGSELIIGEDILVRLIDVKGGRIRLGFSAPGEVAIHRQEIYRRIQAEKQGQRQRTVHSRRLPGAAFAKAPTPLATAANKAGHSRNR